MAWVGYSFPHSRQTSAFIFFMASPQRRDHRTGSPRLSARYGRLGRGGLQVTGLRLVLEQLRNRRPFPAELAVRVPADLDLAKGRAPGVEVEHPVRQGLADLQDQLEC